MANYYSRWSAPMQQPTKAELLGLRVALAIERGRRRRLEHKLKQMRLVIEKGIVVHDGKRPTWLATLSEESLRFELAALTFGITRQLIRPE